MKEMLLNNLPFLISCTSLDAHTIYATWAQKVVSISLLTSLGVIAEAYLEFQEDGCSVLPFDLMLYKISMTTT